MRKGVLQCHHRQYVSMSVGKRVCACNFMSVKATNECVKVPMPAHQVLPLTACIFEASYSTSATQANKI